MKTALVTGASTGIGAEFARQIAAQKNNLVLVARSEDKLQELAEELQSKYGIQAYAIVELTGLFLPPMKRQGAGGIINIASIAGFQPLPKMSVYAATKAFVLSFTEALWAENKDTGVKILVVCPGPTESEFYKAAEFPTSLMEKNKNSMKLTSNTTVVTEALKALEHEQSNIVTGGLLNQFIVNLPRFVPRDLLVKQIAKMF